MNVPLIGEGSFGDSQKVKDHTSNSSRANSSRLLAAMLRRNGDLSAPVLAPTLLVLSSLLLGSCTSFSNYVSDRWPTWAGGMPKDVPPRPGAPGYDEFLAHQRGQDAAATPPPADANSPATSAVVSSNKVGGQTPPANQPADNRSVVQGGLY